jgi:phosphonate transport system substrate-binding protein
MGLGRLAAAALLGMGVLVGGAARAATAEAEAALEMGIFPYLSVRTLMEKYQPLRDHLAKALGRPVQLVTAPDFRGFVARTQVGQYQMVITAPHFARMAQRQAGYKPLLQPVNPLRGVFLVSAAAAPQSLKDLKGMSVATPDRLAVVTALGEEALSAAGLSVPAEVTIEPQPSHNAALQAVLRGLAGAALVSHYIHLQLPDDIRGRLRAIGETAELPAPMVILTGPGVSDAQAEIIRAAVLDFAERTPEGRAFMETTRLGAWEFPSESEMQELDRYLPALQRALAERP